MKNIFFVVLFFSLNIQCQELANKKILENLKGNLTVASDSSFISFSNTHKYEISSDGFIIKSKQINNNYDLSTYKLIWSDNYYFINTIGGEVLILNEDRVERIDNSFTHKNQLLSTIFTYKDQIFKFGGYGFFGARNFLTYFSNVTNEWEVLITNSKIFPKGIFDNKYFIYNDELYVFGGFKIPENNRTKKLSFDEIWKFSFKTKQWYFIGKNILVNGLTYSNSDFFYNDKFYFNNKNKIYSYDVLKNRFLEYDYLKSYDKGGINFPTLINNDIIYSLGSSPNTIISKHTVYKSQLANLKIIREYQIDRNFKIEIIIVVCAVIFIFYLVNIKKLTKRNNFSFVENKLFYKSSFFELNELEKRFIEIFLKKNKIENDILISQIDSNIDNSQKTRIKNTTLESLNFKIRHLSKNKYFISKSKSKNDKRYYSYELKELDTEI